MKKVFLLCVLLCMNSIAFAESSVSESQTQYKLFPTQNMWTFLKLDTMTGKIWQVQYSTKGPEYRFETVLNSRALNQKKMLDVLPYIQRKIHIILFCLIKLMGIHIKFNGTVK